MTNMFSISDCDTEFGNALVIERDKQDFNVLAGVFIPSNLNSLKDKLSSRATVFRLDITKQEDINAAFELVKEKTKVLHVLVNNSVVDLISPPGMSAYCASNHAFESSSDCLRREMFLWGLRVSIIEPGCLRTLIIEGHHRLITRFMEWIIMLTPFINNAEDPMKMVQALQHAVMNTKPCIRYRPDLQAKLFFYPIFMLPVWLFDLPALKLVSSSLLSVGVKNQIQASRIEIIPF
ncbi:unnamed protein product [Rotaria sp. Silwood1]|nr:unnamed protein product [Rotaria sp. Silwood1]